MNATAPGGRVTLGPLYRTDADRCAELERVLFPGDDPWSAQAFREAVTAGHLYLGLRDPGGRLIGYAGLGFVAGPPQAEAEVHTIGVDPDWQGRGLGRLLLAGLLEAADQVSATVFLEVRTDNETAQALYASTGFVVVGTRKRYYRPSGADAYTMRRDPGGAAPATD
jgi:ribosomal-protein-alanine N-acetyltransferase